MIKLHVPHLNEQQAIIDFYNMLIDEMQSAKFKPGWKKGIYPTEQFIMNSIQNQQLYIATLHDDYVGIMVLNHDAHEGYHKVKWQVKASKEDIFIIHALGVLPQYHGKGIAQYLLQEAIKLGVKAGKKAIRLDVLGTNIPAQKLYTKLGFEYRDTIQLFYEDTGLTDFLLYEFLL